MTTAEHVMATSGGGSDSSDSSTDDAPKKSKQAAAAGQGGGTTRAHVLRSRPSRSLLRRCGRPLSSLVSSISWLIRVSWPSVFLWTCFVKHRHDSASPWAEATGGASRWRTMGTWHSAVSGLMFSFNGHVEALAIRGSSELVTARRAHFGLPLGLG